MQIMHIKMRSNVLNLILKETVLPMIIPRVHNISKETYYELLTIHIYIVFILEIFPI